MSQKLKFEIMNLTWHLQGVVVCVCRGEGGGEVKQNIFYVGGGDKNIIWNPTL